MPLVGLDDPAIDEAPRLLANGQSAEQEVAELANLETERIRSCLES